MLHWLQRINPKEQFLGKHLMHCGLRGLKLQTYTPNDFLDSAGNNGVYIQRPLLMCRAIPASYQHCQFLWSCTIIWLIYHQVDSPRVHAWAHALLQLSILTREATKHTDLSAEPLPSRIKGNAQLSLRDSVHCADGGVVAGEKLGKGKMDLVLCQFGLLSCNAVWTCGHTNVSEEHTASMFRAGYQHRHLHRLQTLRSFMHFVSLLFVNGRYFMFRIPTFFRPPYSYLTPSYKHVMGSRATEQLPF
jgi:hypothetical protein